MTHPRTLIRRAVRDRLKTTAEDGSFPTLAKEKVYASRIAPVSDDDYPAILIYSRDEGSYAEPIDDSLRWRSAVLTIVVEALIRANEEVDDRLDALAEQIEAAFDGWSIPSFEAASLTLKSTDIDLVTENVRKPIGAIGLTFECRYRREVLKEEPFSAPDSVDSILNGHPLSRRKLVVNGRPPVSPR